MVAKGATRLSCDGQRYTVEIDGGAKVLARAIIIATGAEYRKPALENLPTFEGAGVYYGATPMEAQLCLGDEVVVVGGGNSAGQAAVFLAQTTRRVHVLVRKDGLADTMSRYLVRRIEETPSIVLRTRTEIRWPGRGRTARAHPVARRANRRHRDAQHPTRLHDDRREPQHELARRLYRA
jgi:thioredoxin reductase (NADPH)